MASVVPSSISTSMLIHGAEFVPDEKYCLTKCNSRGYSITCALSFQNHLLSHSASMKLLARYKRWSPLQPTLSVHTLAGTRTKVAFKEPSSAEEREDADVLTPSWISDTPKPNIESIGKRPLRKSVMPPVKNEDVVPGATFTGKVRAVRAFGAFVDIGAFTEGLLHISNLSNSYVTDVKSVVSVGQEVKVRVVEVNFEAGRISLTMREKNDTGDPQQQNNSSSDSHSDTPARKKTAKSKQKSSKFIKGQELDGTVKKIVRAGYIISLPEEEEGFLPSSEESVEGVEGIMGGTSLQVDQEVRVRVLHVSRGRVVLTMKEYEDEEGKLDPEIIHVGVVHEGTKPFAYAFRQNKDLARYLDEREK